MARPAERLPDTQSRSDERALAVAFKDGEPDAYRAIYDAYVARVERVCRRMLTNPHDAQEASQETFLRVYQALGRFNGRYQLGAWITRIATNVCLDQLRSRSRHPETVMGLDDIDVHPFIEPSAEPEEVAVRNWDGRRVRRLLASLPPHHRAAIVLRDFEGLSYEEIGSILSLSDCQVKALIHRARQRFKRSWAESLSALVPWRLFDKLRLQGSERSAEAMSQASQTAAACTGVLQQCSAYVSNHVATAVTAAVVGTAAGAIGHAAVTQPPAPVLTEATSARRASAAGTQKVAASVKARHRQAPSPNRDGGASPSPSPASEEVLPSPTPTAEESPSPRPSPTTPEDGGTPEPTPEPVMGPFLPVMGFDWGGGVRAREPEVNEVAIQCGTGFSQRINTVIDDDDTSVTYPAAFILRSGTDGVAAGDLALELWVTKHDKQIYYTGHGRLLDGSFDGDIWKVAFTGSYSTDHPDAARMDMPVSGGFSAGLELDCADLSVVTESVVLGT